MEGSGKESRGAGTASATVQARLHDEGDTTRVTVHTKLNVTGRPAQFGRNILSEVGGKLIGRFADGLHEEIQRGQVGPEQAPAAGPEQPAPTSTSTQVSPATDGDHPTAPRTEGAAAKTAGAATTDGPGRTSPAHQRRGPPPPAGAH